MQAQLKPTRQIFIIKITLDIAYQVWAFWQQTVLHPKNYYTFSLGEIMSHSYNKTATSQEIGGSADKEQTVKWNKNFNQGFFQLTRILLFPEWAMQ